MNIHDPGVKAPTFSPLWLSNLQLPKDRATINAWARTFYALDPDVNRIISQHALLLTNIFSLTETKSHVANQFCKQQLKTLNVPGVLETIICEYFVVGEVFLYLEMDESKGCWSRLIIQNPDYMLIKRNIAEDEHKYYLRPDENLRRICFSNKSEDIAVRNLLSANIVESVKNGENILLDPFNLSYLAHKTSPYEIRGTSFLTPLFDTLKQEVRDPETIRKIRNTLFDITSFEKKSLIKEMLITRYSFLLDALEAWFNTKMLIPICKIQGIACPEVKFDRVKLKKTIDKIK